MNYFNTSNHIFSVLQQCDLRSAMTRVINYFDPNKSENRKTKVLDISITYSWTEALLRLYDVDKTRNLTGRLKQCYDMILYEPPRTRKFQQDAMMCSKTFKKVSSPHGVLIVKTNDFKEKGNTTLKGSFEMWDIFSDAGFYLYDNIVYAYKTPNDRRSLVNRAEIIHSYFMIFKVK